MHDGVLRTGGVLRLGMIFGLSMVEESLVG